MDYQSITACYCGSFDPITKGHLDVIKRALRMCHHLIIGVGHNPHKSYTFNIDERLELVKSALQESCEDHSQIKVEAYDGTTVEFAAHHKAQFIVKGLRGAADYAYEEKMAIINARLKHDIDTVFLFTDNHLRDVSSSVAKELVRVGADPNKLDHYVTSGVQKAIEKKFRHLARAADDYDHE